MNPFLLFVIVGLALLFVAVYLPKNKALGRLAKAPASSWPLLLAEGPLIGFATIVAWQADSIFDVCIALVLLATAAILLIWYVALECFWIGVPIVQEAGRTLNPRQKVGATKFFWRHVRRAWGEVRPQRPKRS